jgi:hypothetical protein
MSKLPCFLNGKQRLARTRTTRHDGPLSTSNCPKDFGLVGGQAKSLLFDVVNGRTKYWADFNRSAQDVLHYPNALRPKWVVTLAPPEPDNAVQPHDDGEKVIVYPNDFQRPIGSPNGRRIIDIRKHHSMANRQPTTSPLPPERVSSQLVEQGVSLTRCLLEWVLD